MIKLIFLNKNLKLPAYFQCSIKIGITEHLWKHIVSPRSYSSCAGHDQTLEPDVTKKLTKILAVKMPEFPTKKVVRADDPENDCPNFHQT